MKYDLTAGEVMDFHARLSDLSRRRMPGVNFNVILDGLEVLAGGLALRRHYESIEEVVRIAHIIFSPGLSRGERQK